MNKKILVVGITLVSFAVVFTGCVEENGEEYETISYTELCADLEMVNTLFTLQSYNYGDTLYIKEVVLDVKYIEGTEQSLTLVVLDLKNPFFNSTDLPLAFLEDKRDEARDASLDDSIDGLHLHSCQSGLYSGYFFRR